MMLEYWHGRKNNFSLFIVIIFFLLTVIVTFPLIFKITTAIPGFFSTDESFVTLWNTWRIKFSILNHLSLKATDFIAYPYGIDFYSGRPISYICNFINYSLGLLTTPALTYNLQVIFNFLLSAVFCYFLVYFLTKDKLAAFLSGLTFGFCPYIFVRSWQHLGETYIWPMPLFLWSIFRIKENNSLRIKIIFILSLVFAAINYAVIYYTLVIFGVFMCILLTKWKENKLYIRKIIFLPMAAAVILLPQFWSVFQSIFSPKHDAPASAWNVFQRPFEDLFTQSARPLSYLLPSVVHPLFGRFTEQFVGTPLYGISFTEHTLYLGWIPIILAFLAVRKWRKTRKNFLHAGNNYYIRFFALLTVAAWLFSQPPWWSILGFKIYMPSFFMHKLLPMYRAYCRFGVVVMLGVAVLAGFGMKFILERFKTRKLQAVIATLFCGLILFEFWSWPPYKVIDVSKPPAVYYWLKEQPKDAVIAEYPLDADSPNEMYRLYQIFHEKKMINYTIPGTKPNAFAKILVKLSSVDTARKLSQMGVKYVLVHHDGYLGTGLADDLQELNNIPKNSGIRLIGAFVKQECDQPDTLCIQKSDKIDIYEVMALPGASKVKR